MIVHVIVINDNIVGIKVPRTFVLNINGKATVVRAFEITVHNAFFQCLRKTITGKQQACQE